MSELREIAISNLKDKGVFQPSRAEIAREMRCRLAVGSNGRRREEQASASRH